MAPPIRLSPQDEANLRERVRFRRYKQLRTRRLDKMLVATAVLSLIVILAGAYILDSVTKPLLQPPTFGNSSETFADDMQVANFSFTVYSEFSTNSTFLIAGNGVHVQVGIRPRNFTPSFGYEFLVNFTGSHFATSNGTLYQPFLGASCLPDTSTSGKPAAWPWNAIPLYCDSWIYFEAPGSYPLVVTLYHLTPTNSSLSVTNLGSAATPEPVVVSSFESEWNFVTTQESLNTALVAIGIAGTAFIIQIGVIAFTLLQGPRAELRALDKEEDRLEANRFVDPLVDAFLEDLKSKEPGRSMSSKKKR